MRDVKELVADLTFENRLLKKSMIDARICTNNFASIDRVNAVRMASYDVGRRGHHTTAQRSFGHQFPNSNQDSSRLNDVCFDPRAYFLVFGRFKL